MKGRAGEAPFRGYLLDTNVVSEARKPHPHPSVQGFLHSISDSHTYISVLTIGELHKGISKHGADPRAHDISRWVDGLIEQYAENILGVDSDIATLWGRLSADRSRPMTDTLLAATAIHHQLTFVTRNITDFRGLPIRIVNPWEPIREPG